MRRKSVKTINPRRASPIIAGSLAGLFAIAGLAYLVRDTDSPRANSIPAGYSAPYSQITPEAVSRLDGVEKIIASSGDHPEIILIAQEHPNMNNSFVQTDNESPLKMMCNVETICNQLYDKYNVKSAIFEGFDESAVQRYKTERKLSLNLGGGNTFRTAFALVMEGIVNGRNWNLYPDNASLLDRIQEEEKPFRQINSMLTVEINQEIERLTKEVLAKTGNKIIFRQQLKESLAQIITNYNKRRDEIVTPSFVERMYGLSIIQRDLHFMQSFQTCKSEGKSPVILLIGSNHIPDLIRRLGNKSYVIVQPQGFSKDISVKQTQEEDYRACAQEYVLPKIEDIKVDIKK